jgi:2-polyprenyl-6-methoxyphenol hydroxylase-like FAD-dependent oxidoreductase
VGDTAHSMPPTLGQGAGLTLMNAYVLARELARASDVPSALDPWERRIRHHGRDPEMGAAIRRADVELAIMAFRGPPRRHLVFRSRALA